MIWINSLLYDNTLIFTVNANIPIYLEIWLQSCGDPSDLSVVANATLIDYILSAIIFTSPNHY